MPKPRLTRVQQDVIDRLRDGYVIVIPTGPQNRCYELKWGQAKRFLRDTTVRALMRRKIVRVSGRFSNVWVLA